MKNSKRKMTEAEILAAHEEAEAHRHVPSTSLSDKETDAILAKAGLQSINLRLPTKVIEKLKDEARKKGLKYQPYVRQILIQHCNEGTEKEKLRAEIREIVTEE